jgi:hypothetical protein
MLRERGTTKSDRLPSYNMERRSQSLGISRPGPSMPPTKCLALNDNCRSKVPTSTGTTLASPAGRTAGSRPGDSPGQHSISAHDPPGRGPTLFDHHRALPPCSTRMPKGLLNTSPKVARCYQGGCSSANAPSMDTFLEDLTRNADRVFYFDEGQKLRRSLFPKVYPRAHKRRTSLKAWT